MTPPGSPGFPSLADWMARHDTHRELALDVWCVLPEPEASWGTAVGALDRALRVHLAIEEELLWPRWAEVPDPPANATLGVYQADHARLRSLLDTLATATATLDRAAGASSLLQVLDHHDRREAASLVPILSDRLATPELASLLAAAQRAEEAVPPREAPTLGRGGPPTSDVSLALATDAPLDGLLAPAPAHPKGARLLAGVQGAVTAARAASSTRARRVLLAEAWNRWRLLALVR